MEVNQRDLAWWGEERCKTNAHERESQRQVISMVSCKTRWRSSQGSNQGSETKPKILEPAVLSISQSTLPAHSNKNEKNLSFSELCLETNCPDNKCQTSHRNAVCLRMRPNFYSFHSTTHIEHLQSPKNCWQHWWRTG